MRILQRLGASPVLAAATLVFGGWLLLASPGLATLYKWSTTASSNANADSTINWAEGMSASLVNDSARAMMAAVAKYRDDMAGAITTGGTSTAYTVTTNQSFSSLAAGRSVCFTPHTTNGATVTLNVDSLGAKPLRLGPGASNELPSGVLVQGTPYCATYFTSDSGQWILRGYFSNPFNLPIGAVIPYAGSSAPNSNFVMLYGQCISRTTYASLFAVVGTTYGGCDGSTTFGVPDLRGRVVAGLDNMGGTSANRLTNQSGGLNGDTLGATGGAETHTLTQAQLPNVMLTTSSAGSHTHYTVYNGSATTTGLTSSLPVAQTGDYGETYGNYILGRTSGTTANVGVTSSDGSHTHTVSLGGSGQAHNNVQPTIILSYIMRVL